jgi:predicted AlkP superfamily phosphohydrolase/phosphomutase
VLTQNEFLEQSRTVMTDSLRMFRHHLDQFEKGLLFYYFSSIDQNAHVLWGRYEDKLLEFYQALDGAIGEAIHRAGRDTTLVVMSDHGFSSFDRAVHLNTWLLQQGFLRLTDPGAASEKELFPNVDWSRTQAYALGLNGLYINQRGRESGGNVEPGPETERVLRDISARLTRWRDGAGGRQVVQRVYRPAGIYAGKNIHNAPDLLVGYSRGYRASWQTVLGAIPGQLIEDNTQAWIGDHCMAAEAVPGVLLANRRIRLDDPQLQDVTATVLKEFKVQPPPEMIGRALF